MGLRIALDTNRYTDLARGDEQVVRLVERASEVWLPFIVLGELRAGFAVGGRSSQNEQVLRRFLGKPGVGVLYATERTTLQYAGVYAHLRARGTPIPTNDLWIAALVLEHGLALLTRDDHFQKVAQLPLV